MSGMHLVSINVSLPKTVERDGHAVTTGIFKAPVEGAVMLRALNLDGDAQADLTVHGGRFKAAYAYPVEHYPAWASELGRTDLGYGQFGENFTVAGLLETEVWIGDRYRIGEALVEVSQPRMPCGKLALRMASATFPKRFLATRRTGFYLRVIEEGRVEAGEAIAREGRSADGVSVHDLVGLAYLHDDDPDKIVRALRLPGLPPSWRERLEQQRLAVRS